MDYLYDIGIFILVLGELVFFHELGHFLAAKACGIYCERFSLGMPPRLFGFKFGETDYCIGLLPIGGYVKMAGQEDVPLSDEERKTQYGNVPPHRWFMNKPVWQRVIVIFAGPFMNVVLAVLLFAILFGFGAQMPESKHDRRIGQVEPASPAATAPLFKVEDWDQKVDFTKQPDAVGWKTGDSIVSIDGNEISNIRDVAIEGVLSGGSEVLVQIERPLPEGGYAKFLSPVKPRPIPGDEDQHPRTGIDTFQTALVGSVAGDMPAAAAGIKKGDIITRLNGEIVDALSLTDALSRVTDGTAVEAEVERDGAKQIISLVPKPVGVFKDIAFMPPLEWPELFDDAKPVLVSEPDAQKLKGTGLLQNDTVISIDGEPIHDGTVRKIAARPDTDRLQLVVERKGPFGLGKAKRISLPDITVAQFLEAITPFDMAAQPSVAWIKKTVAESTGLQEKDIVEEVDGKPATWALLRETQNTRMGQSVTLKVKKPAIGLGALRSESTREVTLPVTTVGKVGIRFGPRTVFYRAPLGRILPESIHETAKLAKLTLRTLQSLLTGALSAKEIGGPIMIYQITTATARFGGLAELLSMTALISVNLAIFNLLPLPVLDGGHLMFLGIEAVRRKPVSAKVMEWVQQAGLVIIIGLMLFVTYNDLGRLLRSFLP